MAQVCERLRELLDASSDDEGRGVCCSTGALPRLRSRRGSRESIGTEGEARPDAAEESRPLVGVQV